ncbi:hypothetical protein K9M41_00690 [Candidatus Gracilibacteria bacterium]|nr:hypothetical protein [Candidatus Gracilibacteria bacterium]
MSLIKPETFSEISPEISKTSTELSELKESLESTTLAPRAQERLHSFVEHPDIALQKINALLSRVPDDEIRTWNIDTKDHRSMGYFGTQNLRERVRLEIEESILDNYGEAFRRDPNLKSLTVEYRYYQYMTSFDWDKSGKLNDTELQSYLAHVESLFNDRLEVHSERANMEKLITSHCDELISGDFVRGYLGKDWTIINRKAGEILGIWSPEDNPTEPELLKFGRIFQSVYTSFVDFRGGKLDYNDLLVLESFLFSEPLPYAEGHEQEEEPLGEGGYDISSRYSLHFDADPESLESVKESVQRKTPLSEEELQMALQNQQKQIKKIPEKVKTPEESIDVTKFFKSEDGELFKWYFLSSPQHQDLMENISDKIINQLDHLTLVDHYWNIQKPNISVNWDKIDKQEIWKEILTIKRRCSTNDDVLNEIYHSNNSDLKAVFDMVSNSQEFETALRETLENSNQKNEIFQNFATRKFTKGGFSWA